MQALPRSAMQSLGDKWPDEVLHELRKLRDAMPAALYHVTKRTIEEDLKQSVEELFKDFEDSAVCLRS